MVELMPHCLLRDRPLASSERGCSTLYETELNFAGINLGVPDAGASGMWRETKWLGKRPFVRRHRPPTNARSNPGRESNRSGPRPLRWSRPAGKIYATRHLVALCGEALVGREVSRAFRQGPGLAVWRSGQRMEARGQYDPPPHPGGKRTPHDP